MGYQELVSIVQQEGSLTEQESEDALQLFVEAIAVRLGERERLVFARRLPDRLQDIALAVRSTPENASSDFYEQFKKMQHLGQTKALRELRAVWHSIRLLLRPAQRSMVGTFLPRTIAGKL